MTRRRAAGLIVLAGLLSACTAPVAEVQELPPYVVDEPLPAREELVVELEEVVGELEADAASRSVRVVDALHGELALAHARELGDLFPARTPFTAAERDAAQWIVAELHALGFAEDDVHLQPFGAKSLTGHSHEALQQLRAKADDGVERVELSQNVVARIQGTGEGVIVLGAHYDSVLPAPPGPGSPATEPSGPGDNATAVGLLLETAWRLKGQDLPHSVELVFFGAEHAGFAGAQVFAGSLGPQERSEILLMINASRLGDADELGFDVGLLDPETGLPARDDVSAAIASTATDLDIGLQEHADGIFAAGAGLPFTTAGMRVLALAGITQRIVERPSLTDGVFSPGQVVETADRAGAAGRDEVRVRWTEEGDAEFTIEALPGRTERALYVYGTFLETLLLGFPS